jgi:hypothetical protein
MFSPEDVSQRRSEASHELETIRSVEIVEKREEMVI